MTSQIQADVEQLRHVAQAMREFNAVLHNHHQTIVGKAQALLTDFFRGNFQAVFEDVMTTFDPRVYALSGTTDDWATRLEAFAQRLEEADGSFQSLVPTTVADLAAQIDKLYDQNTPIRIIQTGNGQYLVMLAGTQPPLNEVASFQRRWENSNNPLNALLAGDGKGDHGEYYRDIQRAIEQRIPKGSSIVFAGHSLGGIEANNFSHDATFRSQYNVKEVITFGSPDPYLGNPAPGVVYHQYAGKNDEVPKLSIANLTKSNGVGMRGSIANIFTNFSRDPTGQTILEKDVEHSGEKGYRSSAILKAQKLDFSIDQNQWDKTGRSYSAKQDEQAAIRINDKLISIVDKGEEFGEANPLKKVNLGYQIKNDVEDVFRDIDTYPKPTGNSSL